MRASSLDNRVGYENAGLAAVYPHPDFDPNTLVNDIALLRLERPVRKTVPLSLTTKSPSVGALTRTAGWGWTCEDPSNPTCRTTTNVLQELGTVIAPTSTCPTLVDPATQLCATSSDGRAAMACFGDSGGPMVIKSFNRWRLVGLTVFDGDDPNGESCATNPAGGAGSGIWLNTTRYVDWISQTIIAHHYGR
jgi:secreted trypsin-like serine protease